MKRKLILTLVVSLAAIQIMAQDKQEDKTKRPSPLVTVSQKVAGGATVTIEYGSPALKGRTIGKDVEPMDGKVWRTGANEATVFQVDKAVTIDGAPLPAGKYSLFTLYNGTEVSFIFNKTWNQWGAFGYKEADDQLRVKTSWKKSGVSSERLTFNISKDGVVKLLWGDREASFKVK